MQFKYKVGDKVRVISMSEIDKGYRYRCLKMENGLDDGWCMVNPMIDLAGKVVTIKELDKAQNCYHIDDTGLRWTDEMFEGLATEPKFKVGDMVIGNDPYRYAYAKKGWIGEVKKVHSDGRIDVYGKSGTRDCHMTYTYLEPQYFDLYGESKSNKIVITNDGKTTTATLYRENGTKEVATAKCCPEDTFDFNVGAKLAMERLMKKVEPVPVKKEKYTVGDRIFAEDNINCHPGGAWGTVGEVLDKRIHAEDYCVKFDDGLCLCSHVVPVPTTPEPIDLASKFKNR